VKIDYNYVYQIAKNTFILRTITKYLCWVITKYSGKKFVFAVTIDDEYMDLVSKLFSSHNNILQLSNPQKTLMKIKISQTKRFSFQQKKRFWNEYYNLEKFRAFKYHLLYTLIVYLNFMCKKNIILIKISDRSTMVNFTKFLNSLVLLVTQHPYRYARNLIDNNKIEGLFFDDSDLGEGMGRMWGEFYNKIMKDYNNYQNILIVKYEELEINPTTLSSMMQDKLKTSIKVNEKKNHVESNILSYNNYLLDESLKKSIRKVTPKYDTKLYEGF